LRTVRHERGRRVVIGFFRFEIEPWTYGSGDFLNSGATVLRVTATHNGKSYGIQEIMPAVLPWETELDHYAHLAITQIKHAMKTEYEKS
jgi:hypothetical protein